MPALMTPTFCEERELLARGHAFVKSIAVASIIARFELDKYMEKLDHLYQGYGFAAHKGCGTAEHVKMIKQLGPCAAHRLSQAPARIFEIGAR